MWKAWSEGWVNIWQNGEERWGEREAEESILSVLNQEMPSKTCLNAPSVVFSFTSGWKVNPHLSGEDGCTLQYSTAAGKQVGKYTLHSTEASHVNMQYTDWPSSGPQTSLHKAMTFDQPSSFSCDWKCLTWNAPNQNTMTLIRDWHHLDILYTTKIGEIIDYDS